jgi:hypothetical protein
MTEIKKGLYKAGENNYYFLTGERTIQGFLAEDYKGQKQFLSESEIKKMSLIFSGTERYIEGFDSSVAWLDQGRIRINWLEKKLKELISIAVLDAKQDLSEQAKRNIPGENMFF